MKTKNEGRRNNVFNREIQSMKKTTAILLLVQLLVSCKGQDIKTTYVQKLEFGLKGPVKEVAHYVCKVENNIIPIDKHNNYGKSIKQFDSLGNVLKTNYFWDFGEVGKSKSSTIYTGTGREVSLKETIHFNNDEAVETSYRYVWSDNYHYNIAATDESPYSNLVTLDKDYRVKMIVFKNGSQTQTTQEFKTIYKNKRIQEVEEKITDYKDGQEMVTYQIQVVQEYDAYGNPGVIYHYNSPDKQKLVNVIFAEYQYYTQAKE